MGNFRSWKTALDVSKAERPSWMFCSISGLWYSMPNLDSRSWCISKPQQYFSAVKLPMEVYKIKRFVHEYFYIQHLYGTPCIQTNLFCGRWQSSIASKAGIRPSVSNLTYQFLGLYATESHHNNAGRVLKFVFSEFIDVVRFNFNIQILCIHQHLLWDQMVLVLNDHSELHRWYESRFA